MSTRVADQTLCSPEKEAIQTDSGEEKMAKRVNAESGGGGGGGSWSDGMSPEVLALIFVRIPVDEMLRIVPFVCRSWRDAVKGPYCWAEIDVQQWCRRVNRSDVIDFAIRKLIMWSGGTLSRLCAYRLGNSGFFYAANAARCLNVLQIPMSEVTDQRVEKCAQSLIRLKLLDISCCLNITFKGIEMLGKSCNSLVHLRRNMPPPDIDDGIENGVASKAKEEEALAVANTMSGLEHLELNFGHFSDHGLIAIISNCKALRILDIRGCWSVRMEGDLEDKCCEIKDFRGPWEDDYDYADIFDEGDNIDDSAGVVIVDTSDKSDY